MLSDRESLYRGSGPGIAFPERGGYHRFWRSSLLRGPNFVARNPTRSAKMGSVLLSCCCWAANQLCDSRPRTRLFAGVFVAPSSRVDSDLVPRRWLCSCWVANQLCDSRPRTGLFAGVSDWDANQQRVSRPRTGLFRSFRFVSQYHHRADGFLRFRYDVR